MNFFTFSIQYITQNNYRLTVNFKGTVVKHSGCERFSLFVPLSTIEFCNSLEKFIWLYKFSLKTFRKNRTAKNFAPGTCVLQISLRDKSRMGRECFRAKLMWVGAATC